MWKFVLLGIHLVLNGLMVAVVLLQKSYQSKNPIGGFVPRGRADFVTYFTMALAIGILINTTAMTWYFNAPNYEVRRNR